MAVTALSSLSSEYCTRETPTTSPEEEATHTCGCRGRQKLRSTGNLGLTVGGEGKTCVYAEVRRGGTGAKMQRTQCSGCILLRLHRGLCPQHLQASALGPLLSRCSEEQTLNEIQQNATWSSDLHLHFHHTLDEIIQNALGLERYYVTEKDNRQVC